MGLLGPQAVCMPIRLWCHAGKYHCARGYLPGYSVQELESILAWTGEVGKLVEALLKIKFIDKMRDGFKIHDWVEHSGHLNVFKRRAKTAAKARWDKYASSTPSSNAKHPSSNAPSYLNPLNQTKPPKPIKEEEKKSAQSRKLSDEEFIDTVKSNVAYQHIDFDVEFGKMDAWLLLRPGRQKTRRFIVNWLNKIDKAVSGGAVPQQKCQCAKDGPCEDYALPGSKYCQPHKEFYATVSKRRTA